VTVIATIHQPSSMIMNEFDRVILLNEGHTIYQGPVTRVAPYCETLGLSFPKYSNPADFLLKLV
jgi:ABC-type multidrug transport system ATPase subunit